MEESKNSKKTLPLISFIIHCKGLSDKVLVSVHEHIFMLLCDIDNMLIMHISKQLI